MANCSRRLSLWERERTSAASPPPDRGLRTWFYAGDTANPRMAKRAGVSVPRRRRSIDPPGTARLLNISRRPKAGSSDAGRWLYPPFRAAHSRKRKGRRVVSETVPRGQEARQQAEILAAAETKGSHGRRRWVALSIVAVLLAGAVSAWRSGVFPRLRHPGVEGRGRPHRRPRW